MRIFMQIPAIPNQAPRYYHLILQQDLLGGWLLTREWGQQGARSSIKREVFVNRQDAETAFLGLRDQQLKRGFQVMFTQGAEPPSELRYEV
jgi:predicted DNA-binding WGR domain protein